MAGGNQVESVTSNILLGGVRQSFTKTFEIHCYEVHLGGIFTLLPDMILVISRD